ncbi:phosphopantetheine-binding protein [Paracoccus litorisediminis]|uniref:Isochorismatase n=1 Tax=Paracoccus litorisediminis TaxID=2006130 RepID=A0A844HKS9_9RHOB|nr:phosphopantetheine-binding protein [Paracoccus litorisediminis]MTH58987.1 isochorismatase [Paracoccus litorisediminis]
MTTLTETAELSPEWLATRVLSLIEDETEIDPTENLVLYGLDSISVMTLSSELKQRGIEASFDELAREPTLNAWWALIAARR